MGTTRVKIIVVCHKKSETIREDEIYMPIHVGKMLHPEVSLPFQTDDTGDNISGRNDTFCELTAIYWAWKNLRDVDYVGFCHYRRYFDFRRKLPLTPYHISDTEFAGLDSDNEELSEIVRSGKTVLAQRESFLQPIFHNYCNSHHSDDMSQLMEIIDRVHPGDGKQVREFFLTEYRLSPYNMFLMPWAEFNRMCEWLFPVLFEAERTINIDNFNNYQRRIFGFMSERLVNAFVHIRKINPLYLPVYIVDEGPTNNMPKRRYLKHRLICRLIHELRQRDKI